MAGSVNDDCHDRAMPRTMSVRGRPIEVVAHRGASESAPEHTRAAYRIALAEGADGLECDIRLTTDRHLVCHHDRRLDRTSNGRGLVSLRSLAALADLDFGAWKVGHDHGEDHVGILTLDQLFDMAADQPAPVTLAIETKHPVVYGGAVERRLVKELTRRGWATPGDGLPRVRVMSFSQLALRRVRRIAPQLPLVYLMDRVPPWLRDGSLPSGARAAGPSIATVRSRPDYIRRVQAAGHEVHVWTVDDPDDVALCQDLGVDTIITNRPADVLKLLDSG
jgi:glycerophosphoryl diester phosphodiesterase